jgi:hypothetical protein
MALRAAAGLPFGGAEVFGVPVGGLVLRWVAAAGWPHQGRPDGKSDHE